MRAAGLGAKGAPAFAAGRDLVALVRPSAHRTGALTGIWDTHEGCRRLARHASVQSQSRHLLVGHPAPRATEWRPGMCGDPADSIAASDYRKLLVTLRWHFALCQDSFRLHTIRILGANHEGKAGKIPMRSPRLLQAPLRAIARRLSLAIRVIGNGAAVLQPSERAITPKPAGLQAALVICSRPARQCQRGLQRWQSAIR